MNVSTKTLATAVTASMILTGSSYAGTVTAIQDTYVHEQDNVNHGMSTDFRIKKDDNHDRIAYIEFDLSDYVGQTLDSASLTLQGIGAGSGDGNGDQFNLLVLGLDPSEAGSWSETVITGGSHPAASGNDTTSNNQMLDVTKLSLGTGTTERPDPLAEETITIDTSSNVLYTGIGAGDADFLGFLNTAKESNAGLVTLVLWTDTEANSTWGSFASSENTTLQAPTLNLTVPEPGSLALLALGGLLIGARRRRD